MDVAKVIEIQNQIASKIEELRGRIGTHRGYLTGSETRTRQLLIDPMLRVLGWDIENPDRVHLEYSVSGGRVDYVLMSSGQVVVVIEAKVLGKNLDNLGPGQLLKYAKDPDLQHLKLVVITDGDIWRIYSMESNPEKVFGISKLQPLESAQIAVDLWEQNITVTDSGTTDPVTKVGWIPLTDANPPPNGLKPKSVRFELEGLSEVDLESNKDLLLKVANWLANIKTREEWLKLDDPHVHTSDSDAQHPSRLDNGLYIDFYSISNWDYILSKSKKWLRHFGYDASKVYVKFD